MAESEIDPDILSEITDNFYDQEPFGDFQLVQSNERLFREVDPDNFLEINENVNTRKKTMYDMKLVNAFLMSKNETRLVQFIPPDELNSHLCNFILAVTKNDGSEYEPTTLRGFLGSVDRHLRSVDSPVSIFRDKEFSKTRAVLKRKQQELKKIGLGNKPKAAETLDEWMIAKMHEAGTLGTTNPRALLHSMWFICTTYFGMRTGKEIHQLCWGDVKLSLDEVSGTEYIILDTERQTKTRTGENPRNIRAVKPRAYENQENPESNPVYIYKVFASKRPVEMCTDDSPFFLTPGTKATKCWFKKCAMGINSIYNIMNEMKKDAGIDNPRITPYSSRKRLIQKLSDDGVPANQIMQISGHKNVNSINNYSKLNPDQSRQISDILSNKSTCTNAISLVRPATATASNPASALELTHGAATNSNGNFPPGFFINSNIHGNVIINMGSKTESQQLSQTNHLQYSGHHTPSPASPNIESPRQRPFKRIRYVVDSDSD